MSTSAVSRTGCQRLQSAGQGVNVCSQQDSVSTSAVSRMGYQRLQSVGQGVNVCSQQDSRVSTYAVVGPLTLLPLINRHPGRGIPSCSQGWS